jgi:hypothetical protein
MLNSLPLVCMHMTQPPERNIDKLIDMEWDIMKDLRKMLIDPGLSATEKIRAANALAYHASVLKNLLSQKGESSQFNDSNLGDFIKGIQPKIARRVRSDFRIWTRKLSLKK